jgi:hypothetical protein
VFLDHVKNYNRNCVYTVSISPIKMLWGRSYSRKNRSRKMKYKVVGRHTSLSCGFPLTMKKNKNDLQDHTGARQNHGEHNLFQENLSPQMWESMGEKCSYEGTEGVKAGTQLLVGILLRIYHKVKGTSLWPWLLLLGLCHKNNHTSEQGHLLKHIYCNII